MELSIEMRGYESLASALDSMLSQIRNKAKFYAESKVIMFSDVMRHFQSEEGPEGKWVGIKYRKGKILQDSGRLRASITSISSQDGAEVGTNMIYGPTHQFGDESRNIPQRTFCWLSDEAANRIVDNANLYFWGQK